MPLRLDIQTLEEMNVGVIRLDRQAQILEHNPAAAQWVEHSEPLCAALRQLIDDAVQGRTRLPKRIDLRAGAKHPSRQSPTAWLCRNGHEDYAVYVLPQERRAPSPRLALPQATGKELFDMLGAEIREQMAALRALLQPEAGTRDELAASAQSNRIDLMLLSISDLALMLQRDHVFDDEQMVLEDLMREILPSLASDRGVHYRFTPPSGNPGKIQGHAAWLGHALRVLLEILGQGAPARGEIRIGMRQWDHSLVLSAHIVRDQNDGASAQPEAVPQGSPPSAVKASIQRLMCRRIIDLHAGQLQFDYAPCASGTADDPIESFTLTLATGRPPERRDGSECRHLPQAQADSALLLSRQESAP
jgi:hypothetical protein